MREWIDLFEDVVDFDQATVERDGPRYYMLLPLKNGGKIMVDVGVVLNTLIVRDIRAFGENPDSFGTTTANGSRWNAFKIGPTEVRKMLNFVVNRVRQDYPRIKDIKGNRVTGARAQDGKNNYAQIGIR